MITRSPGSTSTKSHAPRNGSDRIALVAFAVVIGVAFPLYLVLGHRQWFFLDEWDFIASRHAGSLNDLFRPHNEHWTTLPILAYRLLYRLFGLRTYVPYQLVAILLHLTAAVLLFVIMRRSGVRAWLAVAAASLFALFGAGSQNIVWGFQMAFTAPLVLGLVHLLLADHDGPVDRRDWLGLAAGFAALLCSGVAVTLTVVVGVAVLIRRGWRLALFHTVPIGVAYLVWWLAMARGSYRAADGDVEQVARFVATGIGATFDALGQVPGVGILLGGLLIAGLVAAWYTVDHEELRRRAAVPGALLFGGVVFFVISGIGRIAFGPDFARSGRYLHVMAALSLPAIAFAAEVLGRRWHVVVPVAMALFLVGIPGNIEALADFQMGTHEIPGWVIVERALLQTDRSSHGSDCEVVHRAVERHLEKGQSLFIGRGRVSVVHPQNSGTLFLRRSVVYDPANGNTLVARKGAITLFVGPENPGAPVQICVAGDGPRS